MTIDRRSILKGAASLPLAAVLADPMLARAVAAELDEVTTETADGRTVRAAFAAPAATPAPAVLMLPEWWGLNDQIRSVAAEFAKQGYVALAVDMYDGKAAETADEARALMNGLMEDPGAFRAALEAWGAWLDAHDAVDGKIGTVGWCFGGGWALNASLVHPTEATVVYYGSVAPEFGGVSRSADALKTLEGPVLGHFATRDGWINRDMVDGFAARMNEAGRPLTAHWYEADHAFANPSGNRYDQEDAQLAWQRTLEFFATHLG